MGFLLSGDFWTAAATITAIAALFRPEISNLRRKAANRILFTPHHRLEVGFSQFGPTIGIVGSLRGTPNDQFLTAITVTVTRMRDNATHKFDWAVFRSLSVTGTVHDIQYATSFLLDSRSSKTLNIQFHDQSTKSRIEQPLSELRKLWIDHLNATNIPPVGTTKEQLQTEHQAWTKDNVNVTRIYERISREFYWDADKYKATVSIQTADPEKEFQYALEFELSNEQSQMARLGVVGSMIVATYDPETPWSFAHTPFKQL